jgi:prepilin-type N-terminal cleavage/methylation domain-containing protein
MTLAMRRQAFSLVELLVAITIILVLMALMGAGLSAARSSGAKQKTLATISAIDAIVQRHFVACESNAATAGLPGDRGAVLRQIVTADMPDSWAEVRHMKANASRFGSARHRRYVATLDVVQPTDQFSSAECLFMIVMQGGLADCLACSSLDLASKGDKDGDGAPEFLDAWGEPIHYVLWPGGFESPLGVKYFSTTPPFDGGTAAAAPGGTMRPLIFSGGPDKLGSTNINAGSYLGMAANCGNPQVAPITTLGGPDSGTDSREDNVTNLGTEVRR